MAHFNRKNLEPPMRLEEKLRKAREEKGLTILQLAEKSHVALKFLTAIESGNFFELPDGAHRLAYIRKYAETVGLNPIAAIFQFKQEFGKEERPDAPAGTAANRRFYSLSHLIRNVTAVCFIFIFTSYLVWQVKGILDPPKLVVFTPEDGLISSHISTLVQGEAEKECRITINGQEARVSDDGKFEFQIDLSNGLNTIIIKATKKHGKTTTITRNVIVRAAEVGVGVGKNIIK